MVDALSYTEAESRSLEIFKDLFKVFDIVKINPIKVSEIFFNGEAEYWYKCKVNYITLNERKVKKRKLHAICMSRPAIPRMPKLC